VLGGLLLGVVLIQTIHREKLLITLQAAVLINA
jgi:hypothetical protein